MSIPRHDRSHILLDQLQRAELVTSQLQRANEALRSQNSQLRMRETALKDRLDRLFVALAALTALASAHEREALVQATCSWLIAPDGDPVKQARQALVDAMRPLP